MPTSTPAAPSTPKASWAPGGEYPSAFLRFDEATYRVLEREIAGTRVRVAIEPGTAKATRIDGFTAHTPESFAALVFSTFEAHLGVFGSYPYDEYRVVVRGPGNDPLGYFITSRWGVDVPLGSSVVGSSAVREPPHPYTVDFARDWLVHEVFHAWNGSMISATPRPGALVYQAESWMVEGATVYYTARTFPDAFYAKWQAESVEDYEGEYSAADRALSFAQIADRTPPPPGPGLPPGSNRYVSLLYLKGSLVARLLDDELRANDSSLTALMRALYRDYGRTGRTYTNADLRAAAVALGGPALDAFFAAYVDGGAPLPLD